VHLALQCVALADKRRAFPRALRLAGPLDVAPVLDHVVRTTRHLTDRDLTDQPDESRHSLEQHSMSQPT